MVLYHIFIFWDTSLTKWYRDLLDIKNEIVGSTNKPKMLIFLDPLDYLVSMQTNS